MVITLNTRRWMGVFAAATAVAMAAFTLHVGFGLGDPSLHAFFDSGVYIALMLAATSACLLRAALIRPERAAWAAMGTAILLRANGAALLFTTVTLLLVTVAIIDLGLPGENGAELTRRLLSEDPGLAVLLYTGAADEARLGAALDCGARGFALKAGAPQELIGAIRVLAEGGTYVDPRLSMLGLGRETAERESELSAGEREVLDLLARGLTGAQAARELFLSPDTVRTHVRNAMGKLDARTRAHAVALALAQQEIPRA